MASGAFEISYQPPKRSFEIPCASLFYFSLLACTEALFSITAFLLLGCSERSRQGIKALVQNNGEVCTVVLPKKYSYKVCSPLHFLYHSTTSLYVHPVTRKEFFVACENSDNVILAFYDTQSFIRQIANLSRNLCFHNVCPKS